MNSIWKCTTNGVRRFKQLVAIATVLTISWLGAPAQALNFLCPYTHTLPQGIDPRVEYSDEVIDEARAASAEALLGLQAFFSAIRERELGNEMAYAEMATESANRLSVSADLFLSAQEALRNHPSDLEFNTSLPGFDGNTAELVAAVLHNLQVDAPSPLFKTSDLLMAASSATSQFGDDIRVAAGLSLDNPDFASIRSQLTQYVWLGDLLSRIGAATYIE